MGSKYCKINIDDVKSSFDLEQKKIIKVLICNAKLEEIIVGMKSVLKNFKEDFGETQSIYSDIINITNEELYDFIEQKSLTTSELNRTFVELYELFERHIKLILEYVHYQKTQIIFNKEKQFRGDIFEDILKEKKSVESITKHYIDDSVNKLMYSKNITYVIDFIYKKAKIKTLNDSTIIEAIGCCSIVRNCIIHNKGFIDNSEFEKVKLICSEGVKGGFNAKMTHENIKDALRIYKYIINNICDKLKKKYEAVI